METPAQEGSDASTSLESLQRAKLQLEIKRLEADVSIAASDGKSKLEKLSLEIAELKRWSWTKPATIIPVLATLATIGFAQYQGLFDIQAKRLDLEAKELAARNRDLSDQQKLLATGVEALRLEQRALAAEKESLEVERTALRTEVASIRDSLQRLQQSESSARARAVAFEERFSGLYTRIREIARVEVVSAIKDRCGRAAGMPSMFSLIQEPTSPERLARERETADRVFASDPTQCLTRATTSAKIMSELTAEDRKYLVERASKILGDLAIRRTTAMAAYAKYSTLALSDAKELPAPNSAALAFRPKDLDEAGDFAWRVRYAKIAVTFNYNLAHDEADQALAKIEWPNVSAR